jgi:DNA-binding response OmpR family regulator
MAETIDILFGDDDETIYTLLVEFCKSNNWSYEGVQTKEEFLDKALNQKYGIIFTDNGYTNPKAQEGVEMIRQIRNTENPNKKTPIILMSGYYVPSVDKERVKEAGATEALTKPFELIDLISMIKYYLNPENPIL